MKSNALLKCSTCLKNKNTSEYYVDKTKVRGFYNVCKSCKRDYDKIRVLNNIDKLKAQGKANYEANRKDRIKKAQEYYFKNRDKVLQHRKDTLPQQRIKDREKYKNNIVYKLSKKLRGRLNQVIKFKKPRGTFLKFLGCKKEYLVNYLEKKFYKNKLTGKEMSWDNHGYGPGTWQIDHIKPFHSVDPSNINQIRIICHYTNLQPLWNEDHLNKTEEDLGKRKR